MPTTLSQDTIPAVVAYCLEHNIFPSVGELEIAGNVVNNDLFGSLGLTDEVLSCAKHKAGLAQVGYMRPICPAILTGLHIDNKGNCIVDEVTGLNCKWFLLSDPRTYIIGNVSEFSADELRDKVLAYRKKCWIENRQTIDSYETLNYVFGGCGGNPSEIVRLYKEAYEVI